MIARWLRIRVGAARRNRDLAITSLCDTKGYLLREAMHAEAFGAMPEPGMPDDIVWPGNCPACIWWIPAPSEAEDAIAVYRPCPVHDPALWSEMERRVAR